MSETSPKIPTGKCPICGKPAVEQHRPFCSRRCALIDFGRWIGGNYRVPEEEDEKDSPAAEDEERD
ncbi:MAG: DNA gyrase inhibitor YacG [Stellaceae bacterium]